MEVPFIDVSISSTVFPRSSPFLVITTSNEWRACVYFRSRVSATYRKTVILHTRRQRIKTAHAWKASSNIQSRRLVVVCQNRCREIYIKRKSSLSLWSLSRHVDDAFEILGESREQRSLVWTSLPAALNNVIPESKS